MEGSSSRDEALRKTITGREPDQSVTRRRNSASGQGSDAPSHGGKSVKGLRERGQEIKASWRGYNQ